MGYNRTGPLLGDGRKKRYDGCKSDKTSRVDSRRNTKGERWRYSGGPGRRTRTLSHNQRGEEFGRDGTISTSQWRKTTHDLEGPPRKKSQWRTNRWEAG